MRKLTLIIVWSLTFGSCSEFENKVIDKINGEPSGKELLFNEKYANANHLKTDLKSWQSQMEFLKEGGYDGVLRRGGLSFLSYEHLDRKDVDITFTQFFDSPVTLIASVDSMGAPLVMDISNDFKLKEHYTARKREMIKYYQERDSKLKLVKLLWQYKGNDFNTYCVVSDELGTIVYDDIMSNCFVRKPNEDNILKNSMPLTVFRSEPAPLGNYNFSKTGFSFPAMFNTTLR